MPFVNRSCKESRPAKLDYFQYPLGVYRLPEGYKTIYTCIDIIKYKHLLPLLRTI